MQIIDLYGTKIEDVAIKFPEVYQWLLLRVKPDRDLNNRQSYKDNWWIFGEPRKELRSALHGLHRYIATVYVAKHRYFIFMEPSIIPDDTLACIASDDAYVLGVLSSRVHVVWALAQGGTLEDRPRYNKTRCFETFPFPDATAEQRTRIRDLGERLDAHRKARQAAHPELTLTGMYNILEKLRAGETLTPKERTLHEQGLITVLRELHDELDAAVAQAYGWDAALHDAAILEQLADLNAQRLAEEARGHIRWLRPEYQDPALRTRHGVLPDGSRPDHLHPESTAEAATAGPISPLTPTAQPDPIAEQITLVPTPATAPASPKLHTELAPPAGGKRPWPKSLPDRVKAVRDLLAESPAPLPLETVRATFTRAKAAEVRSVLQAFVEMGNAREVAEDVFEGV